MGNKLGPDFPVCVTHPTVWNYKKNVLSSLTHQLCTVHPLQTYFYLTVKPRRISLGRIQASASLCRTICGSSAAGSSR